MLGSKREGETVKERERCWGGGDKLDAECKSEVEAEARCSGPVYLSKLAALLGDEVSRPLMLESERKGAGGERASGREGMREGEREGNKSSERE